MKFALPELPYAKNALYPQFSEETIDYHYNKHHAKYVKTLNELIKGTEFEKMSLEDIIKNSDKKIFNNAAQHWNHCFFWNCLTPTKTQVGSIDTFIKKEWGSLDSFKIEFIKKATENFGSGWTWLVKKDNGTLAIINTSNAENPLKTSDIPLLTVDIWEHAYYIDYRNDREKFLNNFWELINWDFVNQNLEL